MHTCIYIIHCVLQEVDLIVPVISSSLEPIPVRNQNSYHNHSLPSLPKDLSKRYIKIYVHVHVHVYTLIIFSPACHKVYCPYSTIPVCTCRDPSLECVVRRIICMHHVMSLTFRMTSLSFVRPPYLPRTVFTS